VFEDYFIKTEITFPFLVYDLSAWVEEKNKGGRW
jgi:hypothetical protein